MDHEQIYVPNHTNNDNCACIYMNSVPQAKNVSTNKNEKCTYQVPIQKTKTWQQLYVNGSTRTATNRSSTESRISFNAPGICWIHFYQINRPRNSNFIVLEQFYHSLFTRYSVCFISPLHDVHVTSDASDHDLLIFSILTILANNFDYISMALFD